MNSVYFWPVPIASFIALGFAWAFFKQMMKGDEGDETMIRLTYNRLIKKSDPAKLILWAHKPSYGLKD